MGLRVHSIYIGRWGYLGGRRGGGEGVGPGVGGGGGQDGDAVCVYSNTSFYRIGKMHIAIVSTITNYMFTEPHHAHMGIHMHMYLALRTIFEKDTSHGGGVSTCPSVSVECEVRNTCYYYRGNAQR